MENKNIIIILIVLVILGGVFWYSNTDGSFSLSTQISTSKNDISLNTNKTSQKSEETALAVEDGLVGKWQSNEDSKFTREFKNDGTVVDGYEGTVPTQGKWAVFSDKNPIDVAFSLEPNTTYVQIVFNNDSSQALNFKVVKLTPEELDLIYMDRGGSLSFKRLK